MGKAFAHLHDVRPAWLESAAPELLEGLEKLEDEVAEDRERRAIPERRTAIRSRRGSARAAPRRAIP